MVRKLQSLQNAVACVVPGGRQFDSCQATSSGAALAAHFQAQFIQCRGGSWRVLQAYRILWEAAKFRPALFKCWWMPTMITAAWLGHPPSQSLSQLHPVLRLPEFENLCCIYLSLICNMYCKYLFPFGNVCLDRMGATHKRYSVILALRSGVLEKDNAGIQVSLWGMDIGICSLGKYFSVEWNEVGSLLIITSCWPWFGAQTKKSFFEPHAPSWKDLFCYSKIHSCGQCGGNWSTYCLKSAWMWSLIHRTGPSE